MTQSASPDAPREHGPYMGGKVLGGKPIGIAVTNGIEEDDTPELKRLDTVNGGFQPGTVLPMPHLGPGGGPINHDRPEPDTDPNARGHHGGPKPAAHSQD